VLAVTKQYAFWILHTGRIANDHLTAFLAPHGYTPVPVTPGLWHHDKTDLAFTLVVDDFGIKYTNPQLSPVEELK
jgi:hypothetical protein